MVGSSTSRVIRHLVNVCAYLVVVCGCEYPVALSEFGGAVHGFHLFGLSRLWDVFTFSVGRVNKTGRVLTQKGPHRSESLSVQSSSSFHAAGSNRLCRMVCCA